MHRFAGSAVFVFLMLFPAVRAEGRSTDESTTGTRELSVFMIAVEDNGKRGKKVGCGDSVVGMKRPVETSAPLTAALTQLLTLGEPGSGDGQLYNALARSQLVVESAVVNNGTATVRLKGQLQLGGMCDNPRVEAQLRETVLQFPEVKRAEIFINGRALGDVLSEK